jgi:drug/metabolite transporter (DMT)-like permease
LRDHPLFKAYLAMASVCFFWGTTYLGIRVALESFAPAVLVSYRFLLSGSLMLAAAWKLGHHLPRGRELLWTCVNGFLILGVGNGCLTWSEQLIPSSLAALFITVSPFWLVGMESLIPGGDKLTRPTVLGMLVGLAGASILFLPDLIAHGMSGNSWKGFLILQVAGCSWSLGSIVQKRYPVKAHPVVGGAAQQLAVGVLFLIPAMFETKATAWSPKAVGTILYLATFGSIIGYSSYLYALDKLPVALVSLYTYVNPLVAAGLGWIFYREPFGAKEMSAMAIIFASVAVVKWTSRK